MPILSLRDHVKILPPENIKELRDEEIQGKGYEIWKEIFKELTEYNIKVYITKKYIKYKLILKYNGEEIEGDAYPDVCYGKRDGKDIEIYIYSKDGKFLEKAFNLIKLNNNEIKLLVDLFAELVHADDEERIKDIVKQFVSDYPQYREKLAKNEKLKKIIGEDGPISIVIKSSLDDKQSEITKSVEVKSNQVDTESKPTSEEKVGLSHGQIELPKTYDLSQESEEKQHKKWKPECNPDEIDIKQISPRYIEPSGKETLDDQKELSLSITVPSNTFTISERDYTSPRQIETLNDEDKKAIGQWGENFVFHYLTEEYKRKYDGAKIEESEGKVVLKHNGHVLVEIHWLNYKEDKMKEYDIKVVEDGKEKYIEVKSTSGYEKEYFDISLNQLVFAMKYSNYYIYRVYGAGTKEPKLDIFENPYELYREGKLKIEIKSLRIYI